jgi:hypothetical protein
MRLTGLLAVLLFLLIVFFAAPAASFAQSTGEARLHPTVFDKSLDELLKDLQHSPDQNVWELERDGVCYTMRTYVVAREDRESDTTRVVRESRCLPGTRVQFKTALAPAGPNDRRGR